MRCELQPSPGYRSIEEEFEARLRDAFVTHGADYVVIHNRRQKFQAASVAWAMERGWLSEEFREIDEQYAEYRYRLTPTGHSFFFKSPTPAREEGVSKIDAALNPKD